MAEETNQPTEAQQPAATDLHARTGRLDDLRRFDGGDEPLGQAAGDLGHLDVAAAQTLDHGHDQRGGHEERGERDDETWQSELHANMDAAYAEAYRLGGVASGEHGVGLSKRCYFLREVADEDLAAMNAIKDALDPLHILNVYIFYISVG